MAKLPASIEVSARDIPEVRAILEAQGAAILHILNRMQADGRLAYLIGPGSQSYDLLTAAYALAEGKPVDDVRSVNGATLDPIPWPQPGATMHWPAGLLERVKAAEQRVANNDAPRRIPADPNGDVDLVLAEVRYLIEGTWPPFWIKDAGAKQGEASTRPHGVPHRWPCDQCDAAFLPGTSNDQQENSRG